MARSNDATDDNATLELRPLVPDDAEAAADVIHRSTTDAYSFMAWTHSQQETRTWFRASLGGWSEIWLAERAGRLVGVVCLQGDHIDQLFVDRGAQRRGVGSRLLAKALSLCRGPVTLHSFQKNLAARAFYEKHGFQPVAFGLSEAEGEPDVLYRLAPNDKPSPSAG